MKILFQEKLCFRKGLYGGIGKMEKCSHGRMEELNGWYFF